MEVLPGSELKQFWKLLAQLSPGERSEVFKLRLLHSTTLTASGPAMLCRKYLAQVNGVNQGSMHQQKSGL